MNLTLKTGEIAAIMGPNGTGKSTLSAAIMGNPNYEVTKGEILFDEITNRNFFRPLLFQHSWQHEGIQHW